MATPVRTRRRHQRGAAMVEAAFMMPMFVILFFTSIYFHNLNAKQIALNMVTRQAAWVYAMANCGVTKDADSEVYDQVDSGNGSASQIQTENGSNQAQNAASTAFNGGSVTGAMTSFIQPITSMLSSIFPNPMGSQMQKKDSVTWSMPSASWSQGAAAQSTPVQQTVTVYCDEAPQNGSIWNVIKDFMSFVSSLI